MASRHLERGSPAIVERPETSVMYLEVDDEPAAIARGWDELERRIGSLRGRRFLATFDGGKYRASAVLRDEDDPPTLGLTAGSVQGGPYLRVRLRGAPDDIYADIPTAFEELERAAERDSSRVPIELYRRLDEVDLLIPVKRRGADQRSGRGPVRG